MSHYIKNPEAIWTTIKKPFTDPVDWLHDVGETVYDTVTAPTRLLTDTIGNFSPKGKEVLRLPTYDEWGKPGQMFADRIDARNSILPADWRPYAQPIESALLNFIPGVGPMVSAAFNTAYQGGKQQQLNKGFDWGKFGQQAATNFGTAGLTMGANSILNNANQARQSANTLANFNTNLPGVSGNTSSALNSTVNAAKASTQGAANALSRFPGSSFSVTPAAFNVQTSGLGDKLYDTSVNATKDLGTSVLSDTLAPKEVTPISGAMDQFSVDGTQTPGYGYQFGDILNAFGGKEITNPNASGPRIDSTALDTIMQRLSANNYLQQMGVRDTSLPAGQWTPDLNTPYNKQLKNINEGTNQAYNDLQNEVGNYNKYYSVMDANPGLTNEQLNNYIKNPDTGLMGNFRVPSDQFDFFRTLKPLTPLNTSLL